MVSREMRYRVLDFSSLSSMSDDKTAIELPRVASALWITAAHTAELRTEALGPPPPGHALVKTSYSALSRGTEALVYSAQVPESEFERMRCPHQAGDFPFPVKYGYANVGRVLAGSAPLVGRDVFCLFPHQTAYVVPEAAVAVLPEDLPAERAVLAANLETALNAVWDAELRLGDRVSVVGAGVVGCLCAFLSARVLGVEVELIDVLPERAPIAATLGARFALPPDAAPDRDVVFHASASAEGLRTALSLAGAEGRVVELSWFGKTDVSLPLGRDFHVRRLTLRGSQVGQLSPHARARFTHKKRLELALDLCRDTALDALFGADLRFEALPAALASIFRPGSGVLCQRVRYL
jgi:NADPH:quinone reductase-like Zn-dependent oxidoreductase